MDTQIIVEGKQLDLRQDIPVPINLWVTDIKDLNVRTSEFSKTIQIPGTSNNNRIFGNQFDLKVDPIDGMVNIEQNYNPQKKAKAIISSGQYGLAEGYIQLREISMINGTPTYKITFHGRFSDIMTELKGKKVRDLDLTELDHRLTVAEVKDTWNNLKPYLYPFVDYGVNNIRDTSIVDIGGLRPAVRLKYYIDKMFENTEFEYSSTFMEQPHFTNLFIPFNGNNEFEFDEDDLFNRSMTARQDPPNPDSQFLSGNTTEIQTNYEPEVDVNGQGNLNTVNHSYVTPESNVYSVSGVFPFRLQGRYDGTIAPQDPPNSLWFKDHWVKVEIVIRDSGGTVVTSQRHYDNFSYRVIDPLLSEDPFLERFDLTNIPFGSITGPATSDAVSTETGPFSENRNRGITREDTTWVDAEVNRFGTPNNGQVVDTRIEFDIQNLTLEQGDRISLRFKSTNEWTDSGLLSDARVWTTSSGQTFAWVEDGRDSVQARFYVVPEAQFSVTPVDEVVPNIQLNKNLIGLQNVDQQDLFLSTLRVFNLIAIPDRDQPNLINIVQRDEFFADGVEKDFTNKIDHSKEMRIFPIRDPEISNYIYSWSEGSDYYSEFYRGVTDREYGDLTIESPSEFGTSDRQNDIIFEPAVMVRYSDSVTTGLRGTVSSPFQVFLSSVITFDNVDDIRNVAGVGQTLIIYDNNQERFEMVIQEILSETEVRTNTIPGNFTFEEFYPVSIQNEYYRHRLVMYESSDDEVLIPEPTETGPKLVYYTGTKFSGNAYTLRGGGDDSQLNTQYPFISHLNNHPADSPTFDYNFGKPSRIYFPLDGGTYPTENLYTNYHNKYIQEIFDGSNIIEPHMYLSNREIMSLDYNDNIIVDGRVYRINQVKDFDLNSDRTSKIELYRIR